jgi:hypothetical protein
MLNLGNRTRWIIPLIVLLVLAIVPLIVLAIAPVVVPMAAHAASTGPGTMWPYH